jgi:hypothetical protein
LEICHSHLVCIFFVHLAFFPFSGMLYQETSGNPDVSVIAGMEKNVSSIPSLTICLQMGLKMLAFLAVNLIKL